MQLFLAVNSQQKSTKNSSKADLGTGVAIFSGRHVRFQPACCTGGQQTHRRQTLTQYGTNMIQVTKAIGSTHYSATVNRGTNTKPHTRQPARQVERQTELVWYTRV